MTRPHRPLVLAHRGASAYARDNSLEAFRLAVVQGADGVELDVRSTADGIVVLHHDPEVPGLGAIVRHGFAEVRAHAPHVPTLDEAAEVLDELFVDIEIKNSPREPDHDPTHGLAEVIVAWVLERGWQRRVMVSSFNAETVARVRQGHDRIATGLLVAGGLGRKAIDAAAAAGHAWILPDARRLWSRVPGDVATAHDAGLRVGVWTVDSPRRLRSLAAAGVDAVITNDPARALATYGAG